MNVIFLAGVHGVGKGYLGTRVASTLGMLHCTASQLIREEKGKSTWGADKVAADVDDNQLALIAALERRRAAGTSILLDGHFVLRTPIEKYARVDLEVFRRLRLKSVILLVDDPTAIAIRLSARDGVTSSPDSVASLAVEEMAHARFVCESLGLPLVILSAGGENSLVDAIRQFG